MKDTKTRIIEAATELFSKLGYTKTTTRAIAERAGINESTFFRTYKNKDLILSDILLLMTPGPEDLDLSGLTGGKDLERDLQIFIYNNACLHIKHMPVFRLAMHVDEVYNLQRFAKIKGMIAQIKEYLETLRENGIVRDFDYGMLAENINSLVLVRATEFIIGESYGIPSEQSALRFSNEYAKFFAGLLK